MDFYTHVHQQKDKFLVRGYRDGKQIKEIHRYKPRLFVDSKSGNSKFKTTDGNPIEPMEFDSVWEAKNFLKEYQNVAGFNIYGSKHFLYSFIYDNFTKEIDYDPSAIKIASLDIENEMGGEDIATSLQNVANPITAITLGTKDKYLTFGVKDFDTSKYEGMCEYIKCIDEEDLLKRFVIAFQQMNPDVLTGWNVEFYDIPYLVGRIIRLLGETWAKDLSPWGKLRPYEVEIKGRAITTYDIVGCVVLDYLALYKKFTYNDQESFKLDHIAFIELGEAKVDYTAEGYKNLNDLYERNPQLFYEYNVQDTVLINRIEDKMKLIELVFAMAYDAKINYIDCLASVKPWEVIINNYLLDQNLVYAPKQKSENRPFPGGYVKDVQVGEHKWVMTFDLASLYPHLIMQYNISPDTFVRKGPVVSIDSLLTRKHTVADPSSSWTANGCLYTNSRQGFLGAIMEKMYDDRSVYKKKMLQAEKEYEKTKDKELEKRISKFNNLQMAKKIQLNSAYGALGNQYFQYYDVNHAEAITLSGQLSIRWIAESVNKFLNKINKTENQDYVIASDTDSIMVSFEKTVELFFNQYADDKKKMTRILEKFAQEKIQPLIDREYQALAEYMNAYKQKMQMKLEVIADKAIFTAKKRYVMNMWHKEGVFYDKPKLKMTGIDAVKSSTPAACRSAIIDCINIIMQGTEKELQSYVKEFRGRFNSMSFEQIASPRGVSNVSQYEMPKKSNVLFKVGTPINVKGSILYNHLLRTLNLTSQYETISGGDKIKYCYLKQLNPHRINVIACPGKLPAEFKLDQYLDKDKQFERAFESPLRLLLDPIGWNIEHKASLAAFF